MPGNPREMITLAERRFPVRIRIGVPPEGLGQRHTQMTAWLDENCGADGWAMTPSGTRYVFVTERSAPFLPNGVFKMMQRAGLDCGLPDMHPHLLRHACGFKLVNDGVDTRTLAAYLGHRNMANTARYTKMDARRFDGFWRD